MAREVKLNDLEPVLEEFDYPATRETIADEGGDVTLLLADGTENLGDLVERSGAGMFDSANDLYAEVLNLMPRHGVGEPYQSEGEG